MKFPTNSLRFRFIASTFAWIAIGLVLTGLMVSALFRIYVTQGFHDEMQIHIEELSALTLVDARGDPIMLRRLSDPRFIPQYSGFYWRVQRAGHKPISSPSLAGRTISGKLAVGYEKNWAITSGPTGQTLEYGMVRAAGDDGPPLRFSIASDMRLLDEILEEFDRPLRWALAAFAIIMLATGAAQIAYGLRPLQRMAVAIRDVRSGRTALMEGDYPSEITPLVSDLNGLLEANAAMVKKARIQAGNMAHGLRTPLAIILDEAESLAANGHEESAEILIRESQRMKRQIDYQLARARTAAVEPALGQVASLRETTRPIIAAMARLHKSRDISICCGDFPDVIVLSDAIDLGEILSNLIDNAAKWARARAMVSWEKADDMIRIMIDDDGEGIAPEMRQQVFSIGERLNDDMPGSGLGLAIARDLVQLYGGSIALENSPLGGLRVIVLLPFASR